MLVTDFARDALRCRKGRAALKKLGYENVGEGGGPLWELQRGGRYDHIITDVRIDPDGKSLWVMITSEEPDRGEPR